MKKFLALIFALLLFPLVPAEAIKSCPRCAYLVGIDTIECPKCLKLLTWPFVPEQSRRAKVVIRTGTDAFIRHPHAQNRAYRSDRNAGGDLSGEIGVWGGPATLRYLIKFDIPETFALAGVAIADFKLKRATLKLTAVAVDQKITMPVIIYPLQRPFQEGSGRFRRREKDIDGCDWLYSAPLMLWHREGGDFTDTLNCSGIIQNNGSESIIDVTEIIRSRFEVFAQTGVWDDPGMIIMSDPRKAINSGFVTIYSFESKAVAGSVRAPELFIE